MSQKTIKQWCVEHGINWYGQGRLASIRYDWKLAFGHGRSALFSSDVESTTPTVQEVNGRSVLVFPNVNASKKNGKISEAKFLRIIDWVQRCLDGEFHDVEHDGAAEPGVGANPDPAV